MSEELKIRPFEEMEHHPIADRLAQILCTQTQNTDPRFFRVMVAYYFGVIATMMRCTVHTHDRGQIPVNVYAINLATSGAGKGKSTNIMEDQVINAFQKRFTDETFPLVAEQHLVTMANDRAVSKQTDPDAELEILMNEFRRQGDLVFSFDSGSTSAAKQLRHKLLMAKAGSMNLMIDEIGSNLTGSVEILTTYLELYDVGKVKQKLLKNTSDHIRNSDLYGKSPANLLMFGTPSKLLNGSKTEEEFYSLLDTGYARRCLFAFSKDHARNTAVTVDELYAMLTSQDSHQYLDDVSDRLENMANMINMNKKVIMTEHVAKLFLLYRLECERKAEALPEHEEMQKAELAHRYFKAMKLAGAYAFVDDSPELTVAHFEYAVKLVEESGKAFEALLSRDRNWVKLAKYIAAVGRPVTQPDLVEDLPFYKGSLAQKNEMMSLAIAYGYQNNIIIKKAFNDGIEFLSGETLHETDLTRMRVSYSDDIATGYRDEYPPFDQLYKLTQAQGMHWVNHHLKGGHRQEANAIPGFNLVVIDVDHGVELELAKTLLKDYKALYYTTKRHTPSDPRFRIILPTNYELKLDQDDFKEFMRNIYEWLPFEVDEATSQRARKWLSHNGTYEYTDGKLLDVLPFIPKTSKCEEHRKVIDSQQSLDNLERWVINHTGDGNRNNQLLKYAYILVDAGFDFGTVRTKVMDLNEKLPGKLDEAEILGTIMVTVGKALAKKAA